MKDPRGVPVSTGTAQSQAAYETALKAFNTYRGDPVAIIDGALAADPDFVMGHVLRAQVLVTMWERSVVPKVTSTSRGSRSLTIGAMIASGATRMHSSGGRRGTGTECGESLTVCSPSTHATCWPCRLDI